MASIHQEIVINAAPEAVWDALSDVGAIHTRLCPGFVVNTEMDPDGTARLVTFGNGMQAREVMIDVDPTRRRVAWTVESPRLTHHNGSLQVFEETDGATRAVWIADVLPHAAAETVGGMMAAGMAAMKRCLEASA
jgi:uncharacterized protein YndB with AHSA1/START domain